MNPERRLVLIAAVALVALGMGVLFMLGTAGTLARGGAGAGAGAGSAGAGSAAIPDLSIVRLENRHVRVLENVFGPGVESPLHAHDAPRVVYVLEGGVLRVIDEGGGEEEVRLEAGTTVWRPAETHVVRNVGATTIRLLETEVRAARGPD